MKNGSLLKSVSLAIIIAIIIKIIAIYIDSENANKNIGLTIAWLFFTIESWKFLKWKALIPYTMLVASTITLRAIISLCHFDNISFQNLTIGYLVIELILNVGGLFVFSIFLYRSYEKIENSSIQTVSESKK